MGHFAKALTGWMNQAEMDALQLSRELRGAGWRSAKVSVVRGWLGTHEAGRAPTKPEPISMTQCEILARVLGRGVTTSMVRDSVGRDLYERLPDFAKLHVEELIEQRAQEMADVSRARESDVSGTSVMQRLREVERLPGCVLWEATGARDALDAPSLADHLTYLFRLQNPDPTECSASRFAHAMVLASSAPTNVLPEISAAWLQAVQQLEAVWSAGAAQGVLVARLEASSGRVWKSSSRHPTGTNSNRLAWSYADGEES